MVNKNYCVVFFIPIDGTTEEIIDISTSSPRIMKGKGISMLTFSSYIDVESITDYLTEKGRNFLIFDLDKTVSGFNLVDKEKERDFFGFLSEINDFSDIERYSNDLIDDLCKTNFPNTIENSTGSTTPNWVKSEGKTVTDVVNKENSVNIYKNINIDKLSKSEINDIINSIIDKGLDNLNDIDKDMLVKLSKY